MRLLRFCICSGAILFLSGCATTSLFTPYPQQIKIVRQDVVLGHDTAAEASLKSKLKSADWQLYALELGRIQQLTGQYQDSIATFTPVIQAVEQNQLAPAVQAKVILASTGSLLTNDNALPYQLKGYEIILLYQYQALNYLAIHDLADALVAFRRSDELQAYLESLHTKEIAAAEEKARTHGIEADLSNQAQLRSTFMAASEIKSSFQNGLTYFLASFAFEADGDLNDAIVALNKALETAPNNVFIKTKLAELNQARNQDSTDQGSQIVIVIEEGWVRALAQRVFPIPLLGLNSLAFFAFPVYVNLPLPFSAWQIMLDGEPQLSPAPIVDINALAAKALAEDYPLIFTRQALRAVVQAGALAASENRNNGTESGLLGIAATAYSYLMSRADLRSWLMLPAEVSVAYYPVQPGTHQIVLMPGVGQPISVTIDPHETVSLWVHAEEGALSHQIIPLNQ